MSFKLIEVIVNADLLLDTLHGFKTQKSIFHKAILEEWCFNYEFCL